MLGIQMQLKILNAFEIGSNDRLVIGVGRHAHQAMKTHVRVCIRKHLLYLSLSETAFSRLSAKVQFQKSVNHLVMSHAPALDGIQKLERIYGFDQRSIWQDEFQLIGLKMADEMPLYVLWQLKNLPVELLRTILSKDFLPSLICCQDGLERMKFRDCHQFDS